MTVPTETTYMIKVIADIDIAGNIDAGSLQVYVDNAPVGSNFIPAAQFFKGLRSVRVTAAQTYDGAAFLAADVSAKGSIAPAVVSSSYSPTLAYQYADTWVKDTTIPCDSSTVQNNANWNNSQYPNYQNFYCNDCADYVSQCLHAGGIPTTSSWSYSPYTASWGNVGPLKDYLLNHGYITYEVTLKNCKCGDPFFFANKTTGVLEHTVFMVYNDLSIFKYDAHTNDRKRLNWDGTYSLYFYHYAHVIY